MRLIAPQQYEEVRTWYHRFQLDHQESWKPLLEAIQTQCAKIVRGCEAKVVYCGIEGARRRLVMLGGYDHAQIQHFAKIYLIVPHLIDCYSALAAIHAVGLPEPYSLLDMIRTPQSNGYSSLLTNICFDRDDVSEEQGRRVFEIVILTHLMEGVAHQGVTYPLCYQFIKGNVPHLDPLDEKYCIQCLIQGLKREQAQQNATITVFTARGQAKQLKTGSTILDLAYKLHSEIGNHAESAVVNGKWVPLSTTLKNGDQVKINRTDHQRVRSEADLQYVADPATKRRIYKFLNKEPTSKGRHLLATYLRNRDPKKGTENLDNEVTAICAYLGVHNAEELYRMIAEKKEIAALPGQPFATPGLVGVLIMQRRRSVALDVQPLASSGPANDWIPVLDEPGNVTLPFRYCGYLSP